MVLAYLLSNSEAYFTGFQGPSPNHNRTILWWDNLDVLLLALFSWTNHMAMDQYLLIPFLGEWTSIYQLFWCSPGVPGFWHTAILIYMRRDAHWSGKAWISGQEIGKGHDCTILCPCLPWGTLLKPLLGLCPVRRCQELSGPSLPS